MKLAEIFISWMISVTKGDRDVYHRRDDHESVWIPLCGRLAAVIGGGLQGDAGTCL